MLVVVAIAIALSIYPDLVDLFSVEGPCHAISRAVKSWDCEPKSSVTVDVVEGSISVSPSTDGRVAAEITAVSVTKRSQWAADQALGTIELAASQKANSIGIIAGGASVPRSLWRHHIAIKAHVVLHVPDGVRLDLSVAKGEIDAGGVVNLDGRWRGYFGGGTIQSAKRE